MKTLKYGSTGEEVKTLQTILNTAGYNLAVDGKFGSKTLSAVNAFQDTHKLRVDGIVGSNTWTALQKLQYETIGKLFDQCVEKISQLDCFKDLMGLM